MEFLLGLGFIVAVLLVVAIGRVVALRAEVVRLKVDKEYWERLANHYYEQAREIL